jgi:6-phosphofructokinase 2
VVAVSLGQEGALLVTQDAAWHARSVPVTVRSTIGAGDSFTAGMVWALTQGQELAQAFAGAMASAAAALLSDGTSLSQTDDMRRLLPRVQVQAV